MLTRSLLGGRLENQGTTVLAMSDQPDADEVSETSPDPIRDTRIAVDLYNAAWDLLDSPDRSADDDDRVLAMAFASRWHWSKDGGDTQLAIGDWFIGHVAAQVGLADVAMRFSSRALERVVAAETGGWLLASVYEGMARASAAAGDGPGRDRYVALATEALGAVDDPDEREVIAEQLATVPEA